MIIKYNCKIDNDSIRVNYKRIINQIYKLLPLREEGGEWQKPLSTLIEEIAGMDRLFLDQQPLFFSLLCKMEGLFILTDEDDFEDYRRTIFDCISIMNSLSQCLD